VTAPIRLAPPAAGSDLSRSPRRWWVLAVLCVTLLVVVLDNTILNVALPTLQQDLGASQSAQEWIVDSYILVFAGLMFTFGVVGDRYGRRRTLVGGLLVFGIGSALSAFAGGAGVLIATRALMGVGAAAVMPATLAIITNVFDPAERPRAIGIWAGVAGMAVAIGPITGGVLLSHFWWGSVFLVNVPFVVLGAAAIYYVVPESRAPQRMPFDPVGVVLSIAGLVALVYGIIEGGATGTWTAPQVLWPLVAGVVLLAVFVLHERRTTYPAFDVALFRNPAFSAAAVAISLAFFALMGATFFLTYYLQAHQGYSPLQAGLRLLPVAVALVVLAPRSTALAHRYGAKPVVTGGLLLVALSFAGYLLVGDDTSIWLVEGLLLIQGAGMANVMAPATESIMSALPREQAGAGSAVNNTTRQIGGALGVAVLGSVLSAAYRAGVEPALSALPEGARERAGESLGETLIAVERAGATALVEPAREAFISAMHVAAVGCALIALVAAAVCARFLPGRRAAAAVRIETGLQPAPQG
jgi:EmrB/QacA subfamily drug resistance transporter